MIAVAMMAVLVAFTVGGFHIGSAVVARHRAQAAADLAALAAAVRLPKGPVAACEQASVLAQTMSATVVDCTVEHLDVVVSIRAGEAQAAARAGPA